MITVQANSMYSKHLTIRDEADNISHACKISVYAAVTSMNGMMVPPPLKDVAKAFNDVVPDDPTLPEGKTMWDVVRSLLYQMRKRIPEVYRVSVSGYGGTYIEMQVVDVGLDASGTPADARAALEEFETDSGWGAWGR